MTLKENMRADTISRSPVTETQLRADIRSLGVKHEMNLIVHSSLNSIGWVIGGAPAVIRALIHTVGENSTLAMPSATPLCADPETWPGVTVPEKWLEQVRDNIPFFDPRTSPTTMGAIPETFRTWPGTLRSVHPLESVCARGQMAREIIAEHPLDFSEGRGAPFHKLHDLDSWVLLVGVGFNRCTALHFAESLVEKRRTSSIRYPRLDNGKRVWTELQNVSNDNNTHFPIIGEKFVLTGNVKCGNIGEAHSMLFPMRELVVFATQYFEEVF